MGMEAFYNKTVTLFHRFYDEESDTEHYIPTVLKEVNLTITKGANVSKSGIADANTAKLFVNLTNLPMPYAKPKEWERLSLPEKKKCFTISEPDDFFVGGDVSDVEILEEDFFEYIRSVYDDVFKVVNVDYYEDIIPHLEVGGK